MSPFLGKNIFVLALAFHVLLCQAYVATDNIARGISAISQLYKAKIDDMSICRHVHLSLRPTPRKSRLHLQDQTTRHDTDACSPKRDAALERQSTAFEPLKETATYGNFRSGISERVGSKDVEIRLPESFSPLERVALSAEGDLQRIISSYHNSAVTVRIKRCLEIEPGVFDREVDLSVMGHVFCTATSSLSARTPECAHLLREKSVGLGQLFRHLRVYPTFRLLDVGRTEVEDGEERDVEGLREREGDGGFWRVYELDCPGMINCRILERFSSNTFQFRA